MKQSSIFLLSCLNLSTAFIFPQIAFRLRNYLFFSYLVPELSRLLNLCHFHFVSYPESYSFPSVKLFLWAASNAAVDCLQISWIISKVLLCLFPVVFSRLWHYRRTVAWSLWVENWVCLSIRLAINCTPLFVFLHISIETQYSCYFRLIILSMTSMMFKFWMSLCAFFLLLLWGPVVLHIPAKL